MKNVFVFKLLSLFTIILLTFSGSFVGGVQQVSAQGYPQLSIHINENQIYGFDWPVAGADVTVTIDDPLTSTSPDYTASPIGWDSGGRWYYLHLGDSFQLLPNQIVTMTDGSTTRSITIVPFEVTNIDISTDTISGQTAPYTFVGVEIAPNWEIRRHAISDADGKWQVDFSTPESDPSEQQIYDVTIGSVGQAHANDMDGDTIQVMWSVPPNPTIFANPTDHWIHALDWPLNTVLTLTIGDYSATTTTVVPFWDPNTVDGYFDLTGVVDLAPGDVVTVTGGGSTKSLIIANFAVIELNVETNTLSGIASPNASVCAGAGNASGNARCVTSGEDGLWKLEPAEDGFVLGAGVQGWAVEFDPDGDQTRMDWRVPTPRFEVRANVDQVDGYDWAMGDQVTLQVGSYSETKTIEETASWDPNLSHVGFYLSGSYDIQPGDMVTMSNGSITKTTYVTPLEITDFDLEKDIVFGKAAPESSVDMWACDASNCYNRHVTTDNSGNWLADFANPGSADDEQNTLNLVGGTWVDSQQGDDDGDSTLYGRNVPNPYILAIPYENQIYGIDWPLFNTELTLTVGEYTDKSTTIPAPWDSSTVEARFDLPDQIKLAPGDEVTISGGGFTKSLIITNVTVTELDVANNTLSGTASSGGFVIAGANGINRYATAGDDGLWTMLPDPDGFILQPGLSGEVIENDLDGDCTRWNWYVPNPIIRAWANRDQVDADGWTPGETVTLQAGGYEFTDTVQATWWDFNNGFVKFQLSGIVDLQPGDTVSITNGNITKTTTITGVEITSADVNSDIVSGKALPFSSVNVWVSYDNNWFVRHVTADENGDWQADFAHPGTGPDEQNQADIVYWTWISAEQTDDDGDITIYGNSVPTPFSIYVVDTKTGMSRQLTHLPASGEYNPSWSPNGKLIAHDVIGISGLGIHVTDVSTGVSTTLRGADGGTRAAWSPNGRWIAFERMWVDEPNLYYVPAAGGEKHLIRENATHATWSPTDLRVAFEDLSDGKIKTVTLSGSYETVVADRGRTPAWSPNGEWIAFEQDGNIWKVRVNPMGEPLSVPTQLTSEPEFEGIPSWSVDGKWVVFQKGTTDNYEVWQISATGGTAIRLKGTVGFENAEDPAYSLNGQYLAFSGITSTLAMSNQGISSPPSSQGYGPRTTKINPVIELRIRRRVAKTVLTDYFCQNYLGPDACRINSTDYFH